MSAQARQGRSQPAASTTTQRGTMAKTSKAASGTHKVRTTFNPAEVIEVGDAEFLDLTWQGLIFEGTAAEAREAVEENNDAPPPGSADSINREGD